MYYSKLFFEILVWTCLAGLAGVFLFQLWYFVKDIKNKKFW